MMTPRAERPVQRAPERVGPSGATTPSAAFSQATLDATRHHAHPCCLLCGTRHPQGLGLDFSVLPDGTVRAVFAGADRFEGYPDTLHGGILAALLDSAMTNCLFARGVVAVTARLHVRYLHPGRLQSSMEIEATLEGSRRSLHDLSARVRQDGKLVATATATFKNSSRAAGPYPSETTR